MAAIGFKRRFAIAVNDCVTAFSEVWINCARSRTVAVEPADNRAIFLVDRMLGLDDYEHVNYLRAIKRPPAWRHFRYRREESGAWQKRSNASSC